ncbi:MAG: metallophosphoesterase, partial [Ekhidna sp.]
MKKFVSIALLLLPFLSLSQKIYLIGDAGEPKNPDLNLNLLKNKIAEATSNDFLVFLGDNLYPKGLPDIEDPLREEMENKLIPQLEIMKAFPGKAYIIPGNHDWAQGRNFGWERALNMERFVRDYFEGENIFLPTGGCPGPYEIPMGDKSTLIILNTQYFLHGWDKPDEDDNCENKSTIEALEDLKAIITRNAGKHILIAAHHPVYTYGEHHGNFSFKNQMLPLPILGSLQPLFRRLIGNIQDNTHPKYRAVMNQIIAAMNQAENVVYAAGHEHSLQFIQKDGHHFIVSGSGSKTTHVKKGKGSLFA